MKEPRITECGPYVGEAATNSHTHTLQHRKAEDYNTMSWLVSLPAAPAAPRASNCCFFALATSSTNSSSREPVQDSLNKLSKKTSTTIKGDDGHDEADASIIRFGMASWLHRLKLVYLNTCFSRSADQALNPTWMTIIIERDVRDCLGNSSQTTTTLQSRKPHKWNMTRANSCTRRQEEGICNAGF